MNKVKSKIYHLHKTSKDKEYYVRLSVFPEKSQAALQVLVAAGFRSCGREHWLRLRKAYAIRKKVSK